MGGEWNKSPFEQLLVEPVRNGIYKPKEFHGRGAKIVNMGELFGHSRLRAVPMKRVELTESESRRFLLAEGDLIFARRSLTAEGAGKCSLVLELDEATTFESSIIRARPDKEQANALYLYYFFNSPRGFRALDTIRRQVAVAGITGGDLAKLEIPTPPLPEQRAIAHILGTLDDKIELNRRRNQTLEAMARALFKDWFVDFGPVRAKMESREPYLPADLWQLFPDRLDEEDKPEGWNEVAAETVSDLGIGKTPPRKEHQWFSETDTDMRWVSIRDMGDSGVFLQITSEYLTKEAVQKFNVRVVPDNTVILSFKLTVGRVAISDGEMVTNEAIAHLKVGEKGSLTTEYLYSYLREFDYGRLGSTSSIATAVNSKSIKALPVLVPSNDLVRHFTRRVASIFADIKQLQSEAATLAQLRDTLLPKLISGELRIADAEKFLERVA